MRIVFNYPCRVGVVTPDGNMNTWDFGCNEAVAVRPFVATGETVDIALRDGTLLVNVPTAAIHVIPRTAPVAV
jgi:hypothetical protein